MACSPTPDRGLLNRPDQQPSICSSALILASERRTRMPPIPPLPYPCVRAVSAT